MKKISRILISLIPIVVAALVGACERQELGKQTEAEIREMRGIVAQLERERDQQAGQLKQQNPAIEQMRDELEDARKQLRVAAEELEKQRAAQSQAALEVTGEEEEGIDEVNSEAVVGGQALPVDREEEGSDVAVLVAQPVGAAVLDQILEEKDYQVFFVELARFGDWFQTDEYGYVWQPAEIGEDPSWRPYTRGRWLYSDQGWTWASDELFGWAVYHYGRWALLQERGWVWIPGDDWAPAWVSWRSNDDYLGWAPLPPETVYDEDYQYDSGIDTSYDISPSWYSFVPTEHFYQPVASYCVPRATVVSIVFHTTNVTRIHTRNRRVYCGGPDYEWVNRRCGRKIVRCKLDLNDGRDRARGRHRQLLSSGRLKVFAPQVDSPWNPVVQPLRVARDLGRVKVVRGGKVMSRDVVNRFHLASVKRQETARKALKSKEGHQALMRHHKVIQQADEHRKSEVKRQREDIGKHLKAKKVVGVEEPKRKEAHEKEDAVAAVERVKREMGRAKAEAIQKQLEVKKGAETKKLQRELLKKKEEALAMAERTKARRVSEERARVEKMNTQQAGVKREKQEAVESRAAMQARKDAIAKRETERTKAEAQKRLAEAKTRTEAKRRAEVESRKRVTEGAARKRAEMEARKRAAEAKAQTEAKRRAEVESRKRVTEGAARKRAEKEVWKRAAEAKSRTEAKRRAEMESRKRAADGAARQRAEKEARKRAAEAKTRTDAKRRAEMESRKRAADGAARQRAEKEARKRAAEAKAHAEAKRRKKRGK